MKKVISILFALIFVFTLVGCNDDGTLDQAVTYDVTETVSSLKVDINAADFKIQTAENFSVVSNLKYLTVSTENGVLSVVEDNNLISPTYSDAMLTIYIPDHTVLNTISINTGAAKFTADILVAKTIALELGAGDFSINSLNATDSAKIEGGAGKIAINGGSLNNLDLDMGVGELYLFSKLLGNSSLDFGVGKSTIKVNGNKDEYRIEITKGVGSITVDGVILNDFNSIGSGSNFIDISGGVGTINLSFTN